MGGRSQWILKSDPLLSSWLYHLWAVWAQAITESLVTVIILCLLVFPMSESNNFSIIITSFLEKNLSSKDKIGKKIFIFLKSGDNKKWRVC